MNKEYYEKYSKINKKFKNIKFQKWPYFLNSIYKAFTNMMREFYLRF